MMAFEMRITATEADIDELGHVNNAVWVRWIQDLATAHWMAVAPAEHHAAYIWVVVRHEIDYLRAVLPGETVTGRTWVPEPPRGARFDATWSSPARTAGPAFAPGPPGRSSTAPPAVR
jgi:acyl-CoA thioester hydrolase